MISEDDIRIKLQDIQKDIDDFGEVDDCDRREDLARYIGARNMLKWVLQISEYE